MTEPQIMGILNVTPDSFSDGGRFAKRDAAVAHAVRMHEAGASLIDVGGESTRPGAERIPVQEEQRRVLPVVEELVRRGIPVSIDTMNASTARAAAAAGAALINDVSAGAADPEMAQVAAETGLPFVAMHWRGHSATMQQHAVYRDAPAEVRTELGERVSALCSAGVRRSQIILDPGIGFAKTAEQNWQILANLNELATLGFPLLIGASRKSFLGRLLADDSVPEDRDLLSAVVGVLAAIEGVWGLRVHNVEATKAALGAWSTWDANRRPGTPQIAKRFMAAGDQLSLTGLRARGHHGVFEHERRDGQEFVVDLTVWLDFAAAQLADDLRATIDYGELAQQVVAAVERDPVDLLETLAERIAVVVLRHQAATRVAVTVHKPAAPITVPFADVSVSIVRDRL